MELTAYRAIAKKDFFENLWKKRPLIFFAFKKQRLGPRSEETLSKIGASTTGIIIRPKKKDISRITAIFELKTAPTCPFPVIIGIFPNMMPRQYLQCAEYDWLLLVNVLRGIIQGQQLDRLDYRKQFGMPDFLKHTFKKPLNRTKPVIACGRILTWPIEAIDLKTR